MGTQMAPSYANIFVGRLESSFLQQTTLKPAIWWRYIDDIFFIWPHGIDNLKTFLNDINSFHPAIRCTAQWFKSSVTFLDTKVSIEGRCLASGLHTNPTDTHQYLHCTICHRRHWQGHHCLQPGPQAEENMYNK